MPMEHFVPEVISLKLHPELNEKWLQERIAEDPSITNRFGLREGKRRRHRRPPRHQSSS